MNNESIHEYTLDDVMVLEYDVLLVNAKATGSVDQ